VPIVQTDDHGLIGVTEIAELLGCAVARAEQFAEQPRRRFPAPVVVIGTERLWNRADIARWRAGDR
jgi:hypothetical protein